MGAVESNVSQELHESRLQLKIWHPDCWTLQVTERTGAGLIGNGVYIIDGQVKAHLVAYADRNSEIDSLTDAIRESPLTETVAVLEKKYEFASRSTAPGNATRELLVTYSPTNSIHDALVSRGFIPDEPIRVKDGYEYWTVVLDGGRSNMIGRLDEIREAMDAEIEVQHVETTNNLNGNGDQFDDLSERQREVFQLARREGYYTWPRDVSVSDIAEKVDLSQATVLEHLRKAEAKLLGE